MRRCRRLRERRRREVLVQLVEGDGHQEIVRAEAEPLVQPARRVVGERDIQRKVGNASSLQPIGNLGDQLPADTSSAHVAVHIQVVEVPANRCLRHEVRERVADCGSVLLGDQRDAFRDRVLDVFGNGRPRLVEERRLLELLLELIAQAMQQVEVLLVSVADRH